MLLAGLAVGATRLAGLGGRVLSLAHDQLLRLSGPIGGPLFRRGLDCRPQSHCTTGARLAQSPCGPPRTTAPQDRKERTRTRSTPGTGLSRSRDPGWASSTVRSVGRSSSWHAACVTARRGLGEALHGVAIVTPGDMSAANPRHTVHALLWCTHEHYAQRGTCCQVLCG